MATPFMTLTLPDVGAGGTPGTTWASYLNTALTTIDLHDHTSGKGTQVPTAGLSIDADLDFNTNGILDTEFVQLSTLVAKPTPTVTLYSKGVDLYFQDGSGNEVRITQSAALAGSASSGFGGDYGLGDELATYSDLTKTYSFLQDTSPSVPAKLYSADISIGEATTSPNVITIKSPTSLAASYNLTLPTALPASTKKLQVSSSGVMSFYTDPVADYCVYDGPSGASVSYNTSTSWAALAISDTVFESSGTHVSRSGNDFTFSATGTYRVKVRMDNFRTSSGADLLIRVRNTTQGTTSDVSGQKTILASPSDASYISHSCELVFTVTDVADVYQIQAVSSNVLGLSSNSALDGEDPGPLFRIIIQGT